MPEARRLADLLGIRADIYSVTELTKTFLSYSPSNTTADLWQRNALCVAALITYGRTLGSGVRHSLPLDLIRKLGDEYFTSHKYFKDLRDKWVAHSLNNFEESGVTLQAHKNIDGKIVVESVGERHRRTSILSKADMQRLGDLAKQLYDSIQVEIENEKNKLLKATKDMDLSILETNAAAFAIPVQRENHSKSRSPYGS